MNYRKIIYIILLVLIIIPFKVNAEHYYKCNDCANLGVHEYFIDNLKIGQELNTGDVIYRSTPDEELLDDEDTIYHSNPYSEIYPWGPGRNAYAISCYFDDKLVSASGGFWGFIVDVGVIMYYDFDNNTIEYPSNVEYDKNKYWKFEKAEQLASGEASAVYFKSYNRTINLKITNKVNNLDVYKARNNEELKYSVTIKNTGDGYSYNNVITTVVPKGLEINKNKISDNGTFDKENNTIKWNYDLLNPGEEYTFNYYAKVIDSNINEYIGNSYITSTQIQEKVNSGNTIVKVSKTIANPNTGNKTSILILIIITIISLFSIKSKIIKKQS